MLENFTEAEGNGKVSQCGGLGRPELQDLEGSVVCLTAAQPLAVTCT